MFIKFTFTNKQIDKYYSAAKRDLMIAQKSEFSEVTFRFCYEAVIKLAIAVCAVNGLKVKSRRGHHIALIAKLAEYLNAKEVENTADNMRLKRNLDLYDGGRIFTKKEAAEYLGWAKAVFKKADQYLINRLNKLL